MRYRAHAVVLALLPAAGILVVDPRGWSPFGPAKWAAVLVVIAVGAATAVRVPLRVAKWSGLVWAAFLALSVVAAVVGLDGLYAWIGTPQRHFGLLTLGLCALAFVLGHGLDDDGDARLVVGSAAVTGGLAGAWAVAESVGWRPIALAGGDRLVASIGNADYLGAVMALLVPISVGIALDRSWAPRWRVATALSAVLEAAALIGSGARGAWLGVGASVLVAGRLYWRHLRAKPGRTTIVAVAAGAAVVVVALATGVAGRVPAAFDGHGPGGLSRLAEWRVAARVIAAHPVTGTGPEGYRIAFGASVDRSYQRTYGRSPLPDRAHDVVLDVAATSGLPGAALYGLIVITVGLALFRLIRRGCPPWLSGVVLGLVAYGVAELLLFPIAEVEPEVWLLAGLVTVRAVSADRLVRLPIPPLTGLVPAALAVVALVFGVRNVAADRDARASLAGLAAGNLPAARADSGRAVALDPDNIVLRLLAAQTDVASDTPAGVRAALREVASALSVSPGDPVVGEEGAEMLVRQAELSGRAGDWESAQRALAALMARDPLNPQLFLDSGVVDAATRNPGGAAQAWAAAADLAPNSGPRGPTWRFWTSGAMRIWRPGGRPGLRCLGTRATVGPRPSSTAAAVDRRLCHPEPVGETRASGTRRGI